MNAKNAYPMFAMIYQDELQGVQSKDYTINEPAPLYGSQAEMNDFTTLYMQDVSKKFKVFEMEYDDQEED